ncbi:MAG: hypothetical protein AB7I50_12650, partial [Vicinamibacterales bacterium]
MTRSGNLAIADYARDQPDVVAAALNRLGDAPPRDLDAIDDWVLTRPARVTTPVELDGAEVPPVRMVWSHPDVWDETADDAIASLRTGDAAVVHLTGEPDPVAIGA